MVVDQKLHYLDILQTRHHTSLGARQFPSFTTPTMTTPDLSSKADALYEACLAQSASSASTHNSDIFNQSDLLSLNITSSLPELLTLVQALLSTHLFQVLTLDNAVCYRPRPRPAAEKLSKLTAKEHMVYTTIEASHTTGIWTKTLAARTNLHQSVLTKALKYLEGKGWVKQIKSVKYPKRKIYMLKELEPAEEVAGGPWFSDGELDVDFIASIAGLVENHVRKLSWRDGPKLVVQKKRDADGDEFDELEVDYTSDPRFFHPAMSDKGRAMVPYPAGYKGFPTASEILNWIDAEGFIQNKDITLADINMLLDVLVYDGKIERMGTRKVDPALLWTNGSAQPAGVVDGMDVDDEDDEDEGYSKKRKAKKSAPEAPQHDGVEDMYRWVKRPHDEDVENGPGNGFSEAPCSRCPVFRLCEEGGPVDARSCEYFSQWLENDS